jgi:hypothetical protein
MKILQAASGNYEIVHPLRAREAKFRLSIYRVLFVAAVILVAGTLTSTSSPSALHRAFFLRKPGDGLFDQRRRLKGVVQEAVNECTTDVDECDPNAICQDTEGSNTCVCNEGYAGDGFECTDITSAQPAATTVTPTPSAKIPMEATLVFAAMALKETGSNALTLTSAQPVAATAPPTPSAKIP